MSPASTSTGRESTGRRLISIVTPCYNEEPNVLALRERVQKAIEPFRKDYDFEHVFTDNQSEDRTFELLSQLASASPEVRVLRFSRNLGANRALFIGLQHARGDAVVVLQADLQDPPELIPEFIRNWEAGNDVVYGKIVGRKEGLFMRSIRRIYYKTISSLSDVPPPQNAGEFRLTSRRALDAILAFTEDDLYIRGVIPYVGYRQLAVPFERAARAAGRSSNSLFGLVGYGINGLLSTSVAPLRAVILFGLLLSALGFLLTATLVVGKLMFPASAPHGITMIASILSFFSGAQMLALGVVAEYIRKIYVQSLNRPRGFIQDKINLS